VCSLGTCPAPSLLAADEEGTLAMLTARRRVIDELIGRPRGRIFTTAGDSVMRSSRAQSRRCCAADHHDVAGLFAENLAKREVVAAGTELSEGGPAIAQIGKPPLAEPDDAFSRQSYA
jgi:hypothetical protein